MSEALLQHATVGTKVSLDKERVLKVAPEECEEC